MGEKMGKGKDKKPRKTGGYYGRTNKKSEYIGVPEYTDTSFGIMTVSKLALDELDEKQLTKLAHSVNNYNWQMGTAQRFLLEEKSEIVNKWFNKNPDSYQKYIETGFTGNDRVDHAIASLKTTACKKVDGILQGQPFMWSTDDDYIDWLKQQENCGCYYRLDEQSETTLQTSCEDILDLLQNGEISKEEALKMYKSIGGVYR